MDLQNSITSESESTHTVEAQNSNEDTNYVGENLETWLANMQAEPNEGTVEEEPETVHQEIPRNPNFTLIKEETSRFRGADWFALISGLTVVLAGVGGIGSYVGFLLSRLSIHNLIMFDPDTVEATNMSGQLYCREDIGRPKVTALTQMINHYSNHYGVMAYNCRFSTLYCYPKIILCGFDNMVARETTFQAWLNFVNNMPSEKKSECLFIDGRLAAEEFQILCIRGDDTYNIKRYKEEYLFTEEQAEVTQCSYKQTAFCANMIASCMVNLLVNFIANQCDPLIPRNLPFFTYYNGELMFLKTED